MGSLLNDPALLQHDDPVGIPCGRKPVGNIKHRLSLRRIVHRLVQTVLGNRI